MRILFHIQRAPKKGGGAGRSTWDLAELLARKGNEVRSVVDRGNPRQMRRGVPVASAGDLGAYAWADVVVGNVMTLSDGGLAAGRRHDVPVVCMVRGATGVTWHAPPFDVPCIWGSRAYWSRAVEAGFPGTDDHRNHVMYPVIREGAYRVESGRAITLVGMFQQKGADLFRSIAEAMPAHEFLGVDAGWNAKAQQGVAMPPNVKRLPFQVDAREVYRRTRVILWVRGAEAGPEWLFGVPRVAVEAAASSIPCVAHPGDGIRECMGDAPIYVDSHDPASWVQALRKLDAPTVHKVMSERAAAAFAAYPEPETIVGGVESFLASLVAGVPA